jgi:hypothetical protein
LLLREGIVFVLGHDGHVSFHQAVDGLRAEGQVLLWGFVALVVKEDAPQPAGLAPVLNQEVLVGPLFKLGVILGVVLLPSSWSSSLSSSLVVSQFARHYFLKSFCDLERS